MSREAGAGGRVADAAAQLFGDRLPLADRFAAALRERGVTLGLVGPRELDRLWERHLLNCALVTDLVAVGSTAADVGSGAGFPGVVMAIRRPDLQLTLIESMGRRVTWLEDITRELELTNVRIRRARAEDLRDCAGVDVVTARAVAPLERLLEWTWPLCRPGGRVLAFKGALAEREIEDARGWLQRSRAGEVVVETLAAGATWSARIVVVPRPAEAAPLHRGRRVKPRRGRTGQG